MTRHAEIDVDVLCFLERHEARVHAMPGRQLRELEGAALLFDPLDREPFWNRLQAVRWPDDPDAFDRRLDQATVLFAALDRLPHVWPRAVFNEPTDLVDRLIANGFEDVGGGHLMVLGSSSAVRSAATQETRRGVSVETVGPGDGRSGGERREAAADIAFVLAEAFGVADREPAIELETAAMFDAPEVQTVLVRIDGEPAAAAKRTTFDGATYLSSIGTRPAFRGRGLGRLVTARAAADAVSEGSRWVHLGVFADNEDAIRLYRSLGFETVGEVVPDLVLR